MISPWNLFFNIITAEEGVDESIAAKVVAIEFAPKLLYVTKSIPLIDVSSVVPSARDCDEAPISR